MLPKLLGPFRKATCQRCGHSWKIAAETLRDSECPVPCNVCRSDCIVNKVQPGQQIIARRLGPDHQPNRLACVVFQWSDTSHTNSNPAGSMWACKRVWGLPGEAIDFCGGEIRIDGLPLQKNPQQMRQIAIPVASFPGYRCDLFSVFRYGSAAVQDVQQPSFGEAPRDEAAEFNLDSFRSESLRLETGNSVEWNRLVVDDYVEDFSTPRNLTTVDDLLFEIEFETSFGSRDGDFASRSASSTIVRETGATPGQALFLEIEYQGKRLEINCLLDFENQPDSTSNLSAKAHEQRNIELKPYTLVNPRRISCGGWDGQIFCVVDDNYTAMPIQQATLEKTPVQVAAAIEQPPSLRTRFRLTVQSGPVQIKRLAVLRDLYLRPNERDATNGQPEPTLLGENEFFVIGDNLPISIDSRNGLGNLQRQDIWGIIE